MANIITLDVGVTTGAGFLIDGKITTATVAPKDAKGKAVMWAANGTYGYDILCAYNDWIINTIVSTGFDLAVFEELTYMGTNAINQAALHAIFQLELTRAGIPIININPATIKKWAYGKKSDIHLDPKQAMWMAAVEKWGKVVIPNDHQACAAWMADIGDYYLNPMRVPALPYKREVLKTVRTIKCKKKPTSRKTS